MRLQASLLGILLQWLIFLPMSRAMLNGFTTVIEAGKVNCFYENISDNKTLEIEYQVRQIFIEMHAFAYILIARDSYLTTTALFNFGLLLYKPTTFVEN